MEGNILYIAVVLDKESQEYLKNEILPNMVTLLCEKYTQSWKNYKPFCHHMTIAFYTALTDELLSWAKENNGMEFSLMATEIGYSGKAIAVKVDTNVPCANKIKHVTLATNTLNGGKPVDSNYISNWIPLKKNLPLKGRLQFFYRR